VNAVAIITARGRSKRIPRKNIREFRGRPIIAYSIEAALQSQLFDEVMVSTDDEEIAAVAEKYGAQVPFRRSAETSDDYATTAEVLREVLEQYHENGRTFDYACCIYPTAPFVTAEKLKQAYARLRESGAEVVLPVARFSFPIWRAFQMDGNRLSYIWPEHAPKRSQDLPQAFQDAGQFYFFRPSILERSALMVTGNSVGIEIDEREVQDIDNEQDWQIAELKYGLMKGSAE
jgi:N-acylneuraminate cytidylyltransferase